MKKLFGPDSSVWIGMISLGICLFWLLMFVESL